MAKLNKIRYEALVKLQAVWLEKAPTPEGRSRVEEVQLYGAGYAEPGYSASKSGWIALGNWNGVSRRNEAGQYEDDNTPEKFGAELEALGVELEWEDEWKCCDKCGKLVRSSPDSHGWMRYYYWDAEGDIFCGDCVKADPAPYLEHLEGNPMGVMTFELDLEAHGYRRVERYFEHGLHSGQDDLPRAVAEALKARGIKRFIFRLDSVGQFDLKFSVYVHETEYATLTEKPLGEREGKAYESPAEVMKRALRDIAAAQVPEGPGPVVTKIDMQTGKVTARRVSPQDFIDGKALD